MRRILGNRDGMTLVELGIALAMVAIAAAIAMPTFLSWRPHMELKNAASEISTSFIQARTSAVTEVKDYTIAFDLAAETYTVTPESGSAAGPYGSDWRDIDVYQDSSDASVPPLGGDDVVFRPNGTADITGYQAIYLRNNPSTGERYRVSILGATGKVKVQRWRESSWENAY